MVLDLSYRYLRNANDDSNDNRKINIPTAIRAVSSLFGILLEDIISFLNERSFWKASIDNWWEYSILFTNFELLNKTHNYTIVYKILSNRQISYSKLQPTFDIF